MMPAHAPIPQLRRATWLAPLAVAAVLAGVWLVCPWWTFALVDRDAGWLDAALLCEDGHLYLIWFDGPGPSLLDPAMTTGFTRTANGSWWHAPAVTHGHTLVSAFGVHGVHTTPLGLNWWAIPILYPLALCLAPPIFHARAWRRRSRLARAGHCPACAYDLRGAPGPACPECGSYRSASAR